jgi:uncharacterized membrane protein
MKGELMIPESYLTGQVRKSEILILFLVVVSFVVGIYIYPQMPQQMASHWGIEGQVDGYMSKFWGVFLMPIISLVLALLFILLPRIDPLKKNIEQFRKYFDGFIVLIFLFFLYIYGLTIYWNFGHVFNMGGYMIPAMAILFYYCGILIKNSKRNWFIGIKTPWTLSSDVVWDKTHEVGAKLFKASAIICLLGLIWPSYAMWFVLVPILFTVLFVFIYSYIKYKKQAVASKTV